MLFAFIHQLDYQRNSSVEDSEDESIYNQADYGCEQDIPSVHDSHSSQFLLQHNRQIRHEDAAAYSHEGSS